MTEYEEFETMNEQPCEHLKVVRYGKDHYNCAKCGIRIDASDVGDNYIEVKK